MRTSNDVEQNPTAELVPPITCEHPDDVDTVQVNGDYRIFVRFKDGLAGSVDLSRRVTAENAGVFAALRDREVFAGVHVYLGAVTWPGEIDLAPDAMYEAFRRNGEWILT